MLSYESYCKEYFLHAEHSVLGYNFFLGASVVYQNEALFILRYNSINTSPNANKILVVPSIFNSPEILFINNTTTCFIKKLTSLCEVYLVYWRDISSKNYTVDCHTKFLAKAIFFIMVNKEQDRLHLVGHCIGGNIALATSILIPNYIKTLTLLTTPWDFRHFQWSYHLLSHMECSKLINNLSCIPKIYIEILFFLHDHESFRHKSFHYYQLKTNKDRALFFQIEHWLRSGYNLPIATYKQITECFIQGNAPLKKNWLITEQVIDPSKIKIPVCLISAKKDRITPLQSTQPLISEISNHLVITVEGGHISYLVGSKITSFFQKYSKWLKPYLS